MRNYPTKIIRLISTTFVLFLFFSCETDSDLLTDMVLEGAIINEATINVDDAAITLDEDNAASFNMLNNTTSRSSRRKYKSSKQPKNGGLVIQKDSIAIYTPDNDFNGKDAIEITLEVTNEDNTTSDVLMTVDVTVNPTQDIVDDKVETTQGSTLLIEPLKNDGFNNNSNIRISKTSNASKGSIVINDDNTLTYTPNLGSTGIDLFTYTTEITNLDESVSSETGNITVTIGNSIATSGANVYYVTTTGKSSNNGSSESSAWNLQHAFATAVAGDVVYVKAGNYGNPKLPTVTSGTSGNTIKFIGYKTTPGDIVSTNGSTFTIANWEANGKALPSTEMPLLSQFPANQEPLDTDRAFQIKHNYIHIENFMVRGYQYGVDCENGTTGSTFKNLIFYKMGDWNPSDPNYGNSSVPEPTNQKGFGIRLLGSDNNEISNTTIIDAGFIGLWLINCDYNTLNNNAVYVRDSGNASDYLTELNGSNNNVINNHIGNRIVPNLSEGHQGRGFTLKLSNNNTINNLTCLNTRVQINVVSTNNTFNKVTLIGSGGSNQNEFQIYGMSDNNTINDLYQSKGGGIQFLGWTGQEGGYPSGNYSSGNNNYFINPIIEDLSALSGNAIISFHRLSGTADAGTNFIVGGTFKNAPWIINANRAGTITFTNSTFSNIYNGLDTFYSGWPNAKNLYKANYINCSFNGNAFAAPIGSN